MFMSRGGGGENNKSTEYTGLLEFFFIYITLHNYQLYAQSEEYGIRT